MTSSPSALLKLELPADGDYRGLWGSPMRQIINQIEAAIAGVTSISTTGGAKTLTDTQYAANEARVSYFYVSGALTSNFTIIAPRRDKSYVVQNATTGAYGVYIKSGASGAAISIPQGSSVAVRTHASNVTTYEAVPVTSADGTIWSGAIPDGSILTAKFETALQTSITNAINGAAKTGDIKFKMTSDVDPGWLHMDGKTIGNAASGATARANADTLNLFTKLYKDQTALAIYTSAGAISTRTSTGTPDENAAADYAANKRLAIPKANGCTFAALDNLGGTSADVMTATQADTPGAITGVEGALIARNQMPNITLSGTTNSAGLHQHVIQHDGISSGLGTGGSSVTRPNGSTTTSSAGAHTHVVTTESINGGVTQVKFNKTQPTMFGYVLIKL